MVNNIVVRDAKIIFKNFAGEEKKFNAPGNRNFNLVVTDIHEALEADGWNVKRLKFREDDPDYVPDWVLEVTVSFKGRPPRIIYNRTDESGELLGMELDEEDVDVLDKVPFVKADVVIRPYEWEVNGNTGIKAYLKTLAVTAEEDEIEREYNR